MGYARIISGGPSGRYTVELDYGQSTRTQLLAAVTQLLAQIDNAISAQQVQITLADEREAAQILKVREAQEELIASLAGGLPPGQSRANTAAYRFEVTQLASLRKQHAPLRIRLEALKFDRAQAARRVAYWTAFNPIETRQAWCTDFTEDASAGALVATMDIPGESNLIVLAPGCRSPGPADGELTARELMSPAQAYLNAAILPGWQKFKPTYRWGTITAISYSGNTCNVSLFDSRSSAQRLRVNQASTLSDVPIVYGTCNALAFEVGDRVVVQFLGQNWNTPRVVGFVDNPKPCTTWPIVAVTLRFDDFDIASNPTRAWINATAFNATCGVTELVSFSATKTTASSASHRIYVEQVQANGGTPGSELTCSLTEGTELWTASSSAFEFSNDRVPLSDVGTWFYPVNGGLNIKKSTRTSEIQTISTYNGSCVATFSFTGGVLLDTVEEDEIPLQSVLTWLASLGQLPEITVSYGSITRAYQPQGVGSQTGGPPDPWRYTLLFEPVPL
jgi:hypothetical protein